MLRMMNWLVLLILKHFQEYVHSQNRGDVTYRLIKEEGPASSIVYVGSHFRE